MPFYNREEDIRRMKAVLSGEPNLVYFVYGPINSGKTALIMKVCEELPENYRVFYVNFRERDVQTVEDLIRVLFRVKTESSQKINEFLKEILRGGARLIERLGGIPIPENVFDVLFNKVRKAEDVFAFLREYFSILVEEGYRPVFILDEMQVIKDVINTTGKSVLSGLFNFMVRMTKETHLCHSLCATSDCLFIEDIYSNAHLEGRSKYILVDDLSKEEAFKIYEEFGFENKELVWEYIGGKVGDMVRLFEEKKQGIQEKEALENLLKDEKARLRDFLEAVEEGEKGEIEIDGVKDALCKVKSGEIDGEKIPRRIRKFLVEENILFYNPVGGIVRPQSRLLWMTIEDLSI